MPATDMLSDSARHHETATESSQVRAWKPHLFSAGGAADLTVYFVRVNWPTLEMPLRKRFAQPVR